MDCITEMAVSMKRSRESTTALVKEVCVYFLSFLSVSIEFIMLISSSSLDFCCVMGGDITKTVYVNRFFLYLFFCANRIFDILSI